MAEFAEVEMEAVHMAELPPITIRLTEQGVVQVAAIIASLSHANDELQAALTHTQEVSTAQVERIRALEQQLADANRILEQA